MTSLIFTLGSWTIDEPAPAPEQEPAQPQPPDPQSWQSLLAAILDALLPHPEAYDATIAIIANRYRELTAPPGPQPAT